MRDAEFYSRVWDVLVETAGAVEGDRHGFVLLHTERYPCREYRFCGSLGFGGKYRSERNAVDCYPEDMTRDRQNTIATTNRRLKELE